MSDENQTVEETCYLNRYTGETLPVKPLESIGSSLFLKGEKVWDSHLAALFNPDLGTLPEIDEALGRLYKKGIFPDLIMIEAGIIRRSKGWRRALHGAR